MKKVNWKTIIKPITVITAVASSFLLQNLKEVAMTQKHRSISLIVIHCSSRKQHIRAVGGLPSCPRFQNYRLSLLHHGMVWYIRASDQVGAHARHYNAHSIGICYGEVSTERQACRSPESGSVFAGQSLS